MPVTEDICMNKTKFMPSKILQFEDLLHKIENPHLCRLVHILSPTYMHSPPSLPFLKIQLK